MAWEQVTLETLLGCKLGKNSAVRLGTSTSNASSQDINAVYTVDAIEIGCWQLQTYNEVSSIRTAYNISDAGHIRFAVVGAEGRCLRQAQMLSRKSPGIFGITS
jgi:hypothetical protein